MPAPFQTTRIPEDSALKIWNGFGALDDERKADAADILDRYRKQQEDYGEPVWPSQLQKAEADALRLRSMFGGFAEVDKVAPTLADTLKFSPDPDKERAQTANIYFLAKRYGKSTDEVADALPFYRQDYAGRWNDPKAAGDDKLFYHRIGKELADEHQKRSNLEEASIEGAKAALRGDDMTTSLSAWQLKAGLERVNDSSAFTTSYQKLRERAAEFDQFSTDLLASLESNTGKTADDGKTRAEPASREQAGRFDEMLTQMANLTPGQRRIIYGMVSSKAEAKGYDQKGFFAQMLGDLGKVIAGVGGTVGTTATTAAIVAINTPLGLTADMPESFRAPERTPEQKADMEAAISLNEARGEIYDEISQVVASEIDPVKPVLSWLNDDIEKGLIQGPGAVLPFMALSAVASPLTAAAVFTADFAEQNRRDLRSMGYTPEQARNIGFAAAPLQAGAESLSNMLQLGRFPAVQKALSAFTKPIGGGAGLATRYLLNAGLSVGTEMTEEQLQDNFLVPAVQEMLGALGQDVPDVPWAMYQNRAVQQTPELFFTIAPLALVFGGIMTAGQLNLSKGLVSDQLWLEYAGYDAAQASTIRTQPTEEARISKARELWGARAGTAASMETAAGKLAETQGKMRNDVQFRQQELERRGILPVMGRTEQGWRLTFTKDGSTADFGTHEQANATRWQYAEDQLGKVHAVTREALASLESNLAVNREIAVEFKPEARTAQNAVDEGADVGQMQRRVDQGKALGEVSPDEAFDAAVDLEKVTAQTDDYLSSLRILGSSKNEFKDGVLRTTIKLYEGFNPLTLVEEKLEGDAKQIVASKPGRAWLLSSLRNYEQESGDKLFRDVADDQLKDDDLAEAWSHLGQSYLLGRSTFGEPLQKKNLRRFLGLVMRSGLGGALNAESEFWRVVAARAQKLAEMKQAGKLSDDLVSELELQLGIDSQLKHETAVADAVAAEMVDTSSYSEATPGPNGETFSVREMDTEYMAAVEAGDVAKQQAMVDAAAKAAGYDNVGLHGTNAHAYSPGETITVFNTRPMSGRGAAFFTSSDNLAGEYGQKVYRTYLKLTNPLAVNVDGQHWSNLAPDTKVNANVTSELAVKKEKTKEGLNKIMFDLFGEEPSAFDPAKIKVESLSDITGEGGHMETDQVAKKARSLGYDGVIFKGVKDSPTAGSFYAHEPSDVFAVFNPNQIKSADPVTRDAEGNVIPLSQRFNPERNEITFSLRKFPVPPGLAEAAQKARGESSLILAYQAAQRGSSSVMVPIKAVYEAAKKHSPSLTPKAFMAQVDAANEAGSVLVGLSETTKAVEDAGEFRVGAAGTEMAIPQETMSLRSAQANKPSPGGLSEAEARTPMTIYRAGDADEVGVKPFSSWTPERETAERYQDNPGFGGETLRELRVDAGNVLDLTGSRAFEKLAEALGYNSEKAQEWHDNGWRYPWEESSKVKRALEESEFDAIRYKDDFPAGATTIVFTRSPAQISPESSRAAGGTFSLRSGDFASRMAAAFSPFQRDPELRRVMGKLAYDRVMKAAADKMANFGPGKQFGTTGLQSLVESPGWIENRADELTEAWLDGLTPAARQAYEAGLQSIEDHPLIKEMRGQGLRIMRRATALKQGLNIVDGKETGDYNGMPALPASLMAKPGFGMLPDKIAQAIHDAAPGLMPDGYADTLWDALSSVIRDVEARNVTFQDINAKFKAAKKAAMVQAKAEAPASPAYNAEQRKKMKEMIRVLDAILAAVPPEVRPKVGGYSRIPDLDTDAKMMNFIEGRVAKLDVELSKWLKKEATEAIAKVFKKARAKAKGGKKPVGKIGAEAHEWFDLAESAFAKDEAETNKRIEEIQGRLDRGEIKEADEQFDAMQEVAILQTFGGWEAMDAGERYDALGAAEDMYKGSRADWLKKMEDRRAGDKASIESLMQNLGNRGLLSDKDAGAKAGGKRRGKVAEFIQTFGSDMRSWFHGSKLVDDLVRAERKSQNANRDAINQHEQDFADAVDAVLMAKGGKLAKRRARQNFIYDNTRPVHDVSILEGRVVEKETVKAEDARAIVDSKAKGYTPEQIAEMEDQLLWIKMAEAEKLPRRKTVSFNVIKNAGTRKDITLSQAEISWVLALHAQEKLRGALTVSGFDEVAIAELAKVEKPQMREVRAWMVAKLKAEHAVINRIYADMMGVGLPSITNYFPARFVHDGDVSAPVLGGAAVQNGSMKTGALRNRKNHTSPIALNFETHGTNLFSLFQSHAAEMEYWKNYAPLVREMKAVLSNGILKEAFRAKHGDSSLADLVGWVQAIESGGLQDAHFNLAAANLARGFMGRYASTRLSFKLGTALVNLSSGWNALLDTSIPFKDVMASYGRALFGGSKMTPAQALKIDAIQRRLKGGTSPEQQFARHVQDGSKPGWALDVMTAGRYSLGFVDSFAGSWAASASYDANYRIAKKAGLSDADAHLEAVEGVDRTIATTFQPTELTNKSLSEASGNIAWKMTTLFMSEARQKVALEVDVLTRAMQGKAKLGEVGRVVVVNHLLLGSFAWLMRSIAKDLMNGDDGNDDPAWEIEDWLAAVVAGPLSGVPFVGSGLNYVLAFVIGGKAYKGTDPITGSLGEFAQGWSLLSRGDDAEDILKGITKLWNGVAVLVGGDAQVAAAILSNAGLQVYQLVDNLAGD